MKAIIPAAGYGTRMYPLTRDVPKALLDIGGRAVIEHIIYRIERVPDIDEIIIVSNDKFYSKFLNWASQFECSLPVRILNDRTQSNEERLGTVGDIFFALNQLGYFGDLLVFNSDNFTSFDLKKMWEFFREKRASVISIYDVGSLEIAKKMGAVRLDTDGRVAYFKEKDIDVESSICSVGVYMFPAGTYGFFKKFVEEFGGDKSGAFIEWLYDKQEVYGFEFVKNDYWFDIGDLESYKKARELYDELV